MWLYSLKILISEIFSFLQVIDKVFKVDKVVKKDIKELLDGQTLRIPYTVHVITASPSYE